LGLNCNDKIIGVEERTGLSTYSLCTNCNNYTGGTYGPCFVEWVKDSAITLELCYEMREIPHIRELYPLRILKQIATFFLSINGSGFHKNYPDLSKFILDRKMVGLPPLYHFFLYFNNVGIKRMVGNAQIVIKNENGILPSAFVSEFSFPPFGYVFLWGEVPPQDPRFDKLYEITYFSQFGFKKKEKLDLTLHVLPTRKNTALDYASYD